MNTITLIQGDGIGKEISDAVMKIIDATGLKINWDIVNAGITTFESTGELIPDNVYQSLEKNKVALKAPITTPIGKGFRSVNVHLRKKYDLYANIRPIKNIGTVPAIHQNMDIILFRENTEGLYAGIEERISDDERISMKKVTRKNSERIIKAAFEYAKNNNRKKLAVVTKANIMKETDGLFLDVARNIAKEYQNIEVQEVLVDNMAMQLVINPNQFDVIVTGNLYGDILSDLMAGLIGGLGLASSVNMGNNMAIFEAVHGSAPDIAGKDLANPTALLLAACMMLKHLGNTEEANKIILAVNKVLSNVNNYTADLGGNIKTSEFTNKIINTLLAWKVKWKMILLNKPVNRI